MRFRNSRLRTKVTALLVSLTALWAFAAWVTLREGVNLLGASTLNSNVSKPSDPLLTELQRERRLSVIWLGNTRSPQRRALDAQRARTDKAKATFQRLTRGDNVKRAANAELESRIRAVLDRLGRFDAGRRSIDARLVDRGQAARLFSDVVDSVFQLYDSITLDDKKLVEDARTLTAVNWTWEILGREDTFLAGALAAGRFTAAEQTQFVQTVGARRFNSAQAMAELQRVDRIAHDRLMKSGQLARLQSMEDLIIQRGRSGSRPPVTAEQWRAAVEPALAELRQTVWDAGDRLVVRAKPVALGVLVRLLLAGGLGLLAVIASIVVSVTTARALVRQLERLRTAAWELADQRLPGVVERLGRGEEVDVTAEAPALEFGTDEIGQVGQAFNAVQQTAIKVAVEQAELRRGIRDILLSLARRTQTLVRRQLSLLDVMERRELDPTELQDLFRIDHLATRMRRNAENLIVLSGATPARGWRRSVPMVDVLRAAVAEVEDYSRVNVLPIGQVTLAGRAVGDVTHLLAELVENAVSFSPSYTVVQVGGDMAASGYAIEIEDRGLGMSEEALDKANDQINSSPEFNLSSTPRLGLYVVSRLADRYGIRVSLKHSAYGGTTAIVLIPREFVIGEGEADPFSEQATAPGTDIIAERTSGPARAEALRAVGAGAPAGLRDAGSQDPRYGRGRGVATALDYRPGDSAAEEPPARRSANSHVTASAEDATGETGIVGPPHEHGRPAVARPDEPRRAGADTTKPETAEGRPAAEMTYTPSGLPFRVPQASLAAPLRTDDPRPATKQGNDDDDDAPRSPEEIRKVMGAYQKGTRRGRSEAALAREGAGPTTSPPDGESEPEPQTRPGDNP